jgi:hypothetical protein
MVDRWVIILLVIGIAIIPNIGGLVIRGFVVVVLIDIPKRSTSEVVITWTIVHLIRDKFNWGRLYDLHQYNVWLLEFIYLVGASKVNLWGMALDLIEIIMQ